jgi:glycosyltransferase involved in cell wall biosynthesis
MGSVVLSVYYRHKQGGFTKRLYRAFKAIASSDQHLIYVSTEVLPVEDTNIEPVILPMKSKVGSPLYWSEFYIRALLKIRELNRKHDIQTHLIFSFFYATLSILASVGQGVKTITFVRGDDVFDAQFKSFAPLRSVVHRVLEFIGVKYSAKVLPTNQQMRQAIIERAGHAQKMQTLPNDITTQPLPIKLPNLRQQHLNIATVSVLNERKNIHLVIEALSQLQQYDWHYWVIGADTSGKNYLARLKAQARMAGIEERVHFMGWQNNAAAILQDCHLFILPTLMEGSPNALLEAMGYGLPCLASRIPEVQEVLPDFELTFDPNRASDLTHRLEECFIDPHYLKRLGSKTAACKANFSFDWDKTIVDLVREAA